VTLIESHWGDIRRAVAAAIELPADARADCLTNLCTDPAQREEAEALLRACERAATSPVLDAPAAQFAAPIVAEVHEHERGIPESLRTALAGRYTIERELGRGGQATVYLARDERHGRLVALKVLHPLVAPHAGPSHGAARFQREIEFAARLSHPHVLPLFDSGAAAGRLYYITPYVDGESLRERLARTGRPPLTETLRVLRDVARALAHAHRQGILHRDIKPANILLNQDGDALVSDFGVAKALAATEITDTTLALGTPAYMAPEQAGGSPDIDHRADLYAFGVVAYELLTGARPFAGRSRQDLFVALRSETPPPVATIQPEVPAPLAVLVDRLLAKRALDRPRDAAEVLEVLDAVVNGGTVDSVAPSAARDAARGTANPEAYQLVQKGLYLYNTRQRDGLLRALQYFEQAVALDPTYARAYAGIADAYTLLGIFGHIERHEGLSRGRAAANRAIELDTRLAEGHAALAHQLFIYEWNWAAAGEAFDRAIALDARYPAVRMYYASFLHSIGRSEDALAQLKIAQTLDPLVPAGLLSGRVYVDTHRPDTAIQILREMVELDPRRDLAHQLLGHAYLQKGMHADAIASMQRAAALSGARDSAQLAYIYAATDDHAEARRVLDRLRTGCPRLDALGFHVAMAYAGLGDADEAFRWLEVAYSNRTGFMNLIAVATGFESIRRDRRFADLLCRMGLAPALGRVGS